MAKKFAITAGTGGWGTEEAVGATDGILYLDHTFMPGVPTPGRAPERFPFTRFCGT